MRKTMIGVSLMVWVLLLAACANDPAPTQIVVVVTATPVPTTSVEPATSAASASASETASETATETDTVVPPTDTDEPQPTDTDEPPPTETDEAPTLTPDPLQPTPIYDEYQLAEQVFEQGRMFWIRHSLEIWVMMNDPGKTNQGEWYCYPDTFVDGEPEIDPDLIPPDDRYQPRRGFGKLWRGNADIKAALGWAITPEFELTSQYTFTAGGPLDDEGNPTTPGESSLTTLYGETVTFFADSLNDDTCNGSRGRWRLSG